MSDRISWSRGWRGIVLIIIGVVMGANLIAPAVAHVGGTIDHLWGAPGHIKAKVKAYGDGRWAKKTPLASGESLSGAFSAADGNSTGSGGYLGVGITWARRLAAPIADANIVDVRGTSGPNCPGIGQAAPGYLCLYNTIANGVDPAYMYSEENYVNGKVGVVVYWPVTGDTPYVGGTYTVTAP
jgi:hypothetical protein